MLRNVPLSNHEIYHIYNRGAHKQKIFQDKSDYRRFMLGLHFANHGESIVVRDILESKKYADPFASFPADKSLVDVFAYALMPNHFHLILKQKVDEGISRFMRKLSTAYSMYFNKKYEHSGVLFQGRYKSKHIADNAQLMWTFSYIHANPLELFSNWKETGFAQPKEAHDFLKAYVYSSYVDLVEGHERSEKTILAADSATYMGDDDFTALFRRITKDRPLGNPEDGPLY